MFCLRYQTQQQIELINRMMDNLPQLICAASGVLCVYLIKIEQETTAIHLSEKPKSRLNNRQEEESAVRRLNKVSCLGWHGKREQHMFHIATVRLVV